MNVTNGRRLPLLYVCSLPFVGAGCEPLTDPSTKTIAMPQWSDVFDIYVQRDSSSGALVVQASRVSDQDFDLVPVAPYLRFDVGTKAFSTTDADAWRADYSDTQFCDQFDNASTGRFEISVIGEDRGAVTFMGEAVQTAGARALELLPSSDNVTTVLSTAGSGPSGGFFGWGATPSSGQHYVQFFDSTTGRPVSAPIAIPQSDFWSFDFGGCWDPDGEFLILFHADESETLLTIIDFAEAVVAAPDA